MESRFKRVVLSLALLACAGASLAQDDKQLLEDIVSPDIERRDIDEAKIDSENIELGFYAGVLGFEDFGSNDVYGFRVAFHITEDLFVEANAGASKLQETSYEVLSGNTQLLTDDQRDMTYYNLAVGYNLLPGEVYLGRRAFNSNFYLIGGAGNTLFADDEYFTYHYGAGFRLFMTDWIALRADFRNYVMSHDLFGDEKDIQNMEFALGATLFF